MLFELSHGAASVKIRECCEGDELALLILRTDQPIKTDDDATKPEDRPADVQIEINMVGTLEINLANKRSVH